MPSPLVHRSVSAVIRSVSAPPALRIDVVGPDPPPVLLLRPAAGLGPVLRRPAPPRTPSRPSSSHPSLPRWPHSESLGPECATTWPAVRRRVALRSSIAGVACRADGCLPSGGRARSESVSASCAMVAWALSMVLIDLPFSHWTHVTFKQCLRHHPIGECSASSPDKRRRPGSAPGPPAPTLRRLGPVLCAGPLLLDLRVVQAASIHRSTVASLRVTGTRVSHNMAGVAPARSTPH